MEEDFDIPDFSVLPAHIITRILRYLELNDFKNASRVCKSWHYASSDPQIVKNLIIIPKIKNLAEILQSNRRYGIVKMHLLKFDTNDQLFYDFVEKFCPSINKFYISSCSGLKTQHLLKLFAHSKCLNFLYYSEQTDHIKSDNGTLLPVDYDSESKTRIIKTLAGIRDLTIKDVHDIPLIADLLRYTKNLDRFQFSNQYSQFYGYYSGSYKDFFTIFEHMSLDKLRDLHLNLNYPDYANGFISNFVEVKNLNAKSFKIIIPWRWKGDIYLSSLFRQFIYKIRHLEELMYGGELVHDQLEVICQHMVNLKSFEFMIDQNQPISHLANLKQLEKLYCFMPHVTSLVEIDKFFKCKFMHLKQLQFDGLITETNLQHLCENHPNLTELKLDGLLTRNLEVIFKHLTKLQVLTVRFGFERLNERPVPGYRVDDESLNDSDREYEYKITRLRDLEELYLHEPVMGIRKEEMQQLKKIKFNNVLELMKNK